MRFLIILILSFACNTSYGAWSFDETNDDVQITDNALLTFPDGDWTLAGWIKLDDNTGSNYQYFFSWGAWAAQPSFNWYFNEASEGTVPNVLTFLVRDSGGDPGSGVNNSAGTHGTRTDWMHLILQRSGTTVTQYIDNSADGTFTDAAFDGVDIAGNVFFGSRSDSNVDRFLGGDMMEWAKWDRALDASERAALAGGFAPTFFPDSLVWYCPMFGGSYTDNKAGLTVSNTGSTAGDHNRTIYTSTPLIITAPVVAAAARRIMMVQ